MTDDADECIACGKPRGTGTLYDFQPNVPPKARERYGTTDEAWREFAERYRCPVCAATSELYT
jgi:hypothetical protein